MTRAYNEVNFARLAMEESSDESRPGEVAIIDSWFEDESGERIAAVSSGQPLVVCMRVVFRRELRNPQFSLVLRNELRHPILAAESQQSLGHSGDIHDGETAVVRVRFENWLAPNRYELTAVVSRDGPGADVLDHRPDVATLLVHSTYASGALMEVPYQLEITRD